MKKILFFILLIPVSQIKAQPWLFKYNSNYTYECVGSIQRDYENGFLLGTVVSNGATDQHQMFYKIDDNGNVLYKKLTGTPSIQSTCYYKATIFSDGSLLLPGGVWGTDQDDNANIVKLNSCRDKVWCTTLLNNPYYPDFFIEAVLMSDSSIIACSIQNDIDFERHRIHLHKFDKNGQPIWRKRVLNTEAFPLIDDPDPWDLNLLPDGSLLLSGTCYWPDPGPTPETYVRMFVTKIDSEGNAVWLYVHGINDYQYTSGYHNVSFNNKIYSDGAYYNSNGLPLPHMFKLNLAGELTGDYSINIPPVNNCSSKGPFIITENVENYFGGITLMYPQTGWVGNLAIIKIDTSGNLLDFFMPDDSLNLSDAVPAFFSNSGEFMVGAQSEKNTGIGFDVYGLRLQFDDLQFDSVPNTSYIYDSLCNSSIVNSTIAIDNCTVITSNDDFSPPKVSLRLIMTPAPVPARDELLIKYENLLFFRNTVIKCYNSTGALVFECRANSGTDASKLNVENWPAGLYVCVAFSNNKEVGNCKFIVTK